MRKRYIPIVIGALICPAMALADCMTTMRPATEAERKYHVEILTSLKALLPAVPGGWTLRDSNRIVEPNSVCSGMEKVPAALRYEVVYFWAEGEKAKAPRRAEKRRKVEEIRALPAEQKRECEDLDRRSREADRQRRKALAAGDRAEAARLAKESAALAAQSNGIVQAHLRSIRDKLNALSAENRAEEDAVKTEVRFEIAVNWNSSALSGETARLAFPGASIGLRAGENTLVAFGPWKVSERNAGKVSRTEVKADFKPAIPATTVQTVLVRAWGTAKQVDDVLAGLDARKLAALVSR